jgi:hypothetical protein
VFQPRAQALDASEAANAEKLDKLPFPKKTLLGKNSQAVRDKRTTGLQVPISTAAVTVNGAPVDGQSHFTTTGPWLTVGR